ncbi:hypothetical protein, partial [Bacillus altitudinis]
GLRYCRLRRIQNVSEQVLLTAACQNMKKIVEKHEFLYNLRLLNLNLTACFYNLYLIVSKSSFHS